MRESGYQAQLVKTLNRMFTGCLVLKNDSGYLQGIPDLLILFADRWAMLEVKPSLDAPYQPNQEYYLEVLDGMSFAAMICPENEEDVLYDLQRAFKIRRASRISQR
jgi:hypothetical protein